MTPLIHGRKVADQTNRSAREEIAKAVPGAEVVKAFNTFFAQGLAESAEFGGGRKISVFLASDSPTAKETHASWLNMAKIEIGLPVLAATCHALCPGRADQGMKTG